MTLTISIEPKVFEVLCHMGGVRSITPAAVVAKILEDVTADALLVSFNAKVPGAKRSKG